MFKISTQFKFVRSNHIFVPKNLSLQVLIYYFIFVQYVDFDELERDFMQLCKNAQIYNEEASLIHEDSIVLQSVFTNARQRLSQESDSEDDEDSKGSFVFRYYQNFLFYLILRMEKALLQSCQLCKAIFRVHPHADLMSPPRC